MIQRIQTVFVFFAAVVTALLLKLDFALLSVKGDLYIFNARGIIGQEGVLFNGAPVLGFIALITLLHLVVIFLYKKRILQMRILTFIILLLLGLIGVMAYLLYAAFDQAEVVFKMPMVLPMVAAILDFLAIRAIGKDEALIRSLNRIR
jgi:hypothetical protein